MSPRGVTTRRELFLPYAFAPFGLTMRPVRCVLDDARTVEAFDLDRHLVDLSELRFERVALELRLELAPGLVEEVFPPAERAAPNGRLLVLVRCPLTRLRSAVTAAAGPMAAGPHSVQVELPRAALRGSVELTPVLVRATARSSTGDGHAAAAGAKLASARGWELRVDTLRAATGEYLDVRFVSFSELGRERFPWPENLYLLEVAENPVLWLNADHERVCEVLESEARSGERAALREVFFDEVSLAVWTRLFLTAARAAVLTGEAPFDWQEAVLAQFLPALYPDEANHESRMEALRRDLAAEEGELLGRLEGVLQGRLELPLHLTRLAESRA